MIRNNKIAKQNASSQSASILDQNQLLAGKILEQQTKLECGNLLVYVKNMECALNIIKMKISSFKGDPHERLNTSKEVIRNRVLSLTTLEEIDAASVKQGVTK